jgi:membrane peptidoglycan carboxypeptidase
VMTAGTGRASNPNNGVAYLGKTGTTDDSIHTWMVGSSTRVSTAVWVGNIVGKVPLRSVRINGLSAAVLRHSIFKATATTIDGTGNYRGGGAFGAPTGELLTGTGVPVPEVGGQSLEAATEVMRAAGFTVINGGQIDSDLPAGAVASATPGTGSLASKGSEITLYTSNASLGPTEMPEMVGNGFVDPGAVKAELGAQGFRNIAGDYCVPAPGDRIGKVMSTSPGAGATLRKTDPIAIGVGAANC